jgi:hypothetical protein
VVVESNQGGRQRRQADIRIYSGAENVEVGRQVMDGEFVVIKALCSSFYILYTSRGQLSVYSSRTTQLVRFKER